MTEFDPNGRNPHEPGAKLDAGKPPIFQGVLDYFPRAIEAVSMVSQAGADKYAWKGWESVPDGYNRYMNALGRHLTKRAKEGPWDSDFLKVDKYILHDAQVAWNALAALELYLRELENNATK
jgi:hypothetical protein